MSATVLVPREHPPLPIEARCLAPDRLAGLSEAEVGRLPVQVGREKAELGELFRVRGRGSEEVRVEGDAARVKGIGEGMSRGRLLVEGGVGMHAGAGMRGGVLEVRGDVDAWAGAEMTGGLLRIGGKAGDHLGAAYPGSPRGMNRGIVLVAGTAGDQVGARMRRGIIAVRGPVGDYPGFDLIAGTIILCAGAGGRPGARMRRGSIVSLEPLDPLPTFRYAGTYRPDFLRLLFGRLRDAYGFEVEPARVTGPYRRYSGDFTELGRGEVLVWASNVTRTSTSEH